MKIEKALEQVYLALLDVLDIKYSDTLNGTDTDDVANEMFGNDIYFIYNDKKFKLGDHSYYLTFSYDEGDYYSCQFSITFEQGSKNCDEMIKAIEGLGEAMGVDFDTAGMDDNSDYCTLHLDEVSKEPINVYQFVVDFYNKLNSEKASKALNKVLDLLDD